MENKKPSRESMAFAEKAQMDWCRVEVAEQLDELLRNERNKVRQQISEMLEDRAYKMEDDGAETEAYEMRQLSTNILLQYEK